MASRFIEFKPMSEFPNKIGFYAMIFCGRITIAWCNEYGQILIGGLALQTRFTLPNWLV